MHADYAVERAFGVAGLRPRADLIAALVEAWSEPHRHYHDVSHLLSGMDLLEGASERLEHPGWVAVAWVFHDAIYATRRRDNEVQSAAWAGRVMKRCGAPGEARDWVEQAILATRYQVHGQAVDGDTALFLDADLGVLASDAESYAAYEAAIRREYRWVPGPLFRHGRRRVLRALLDGGPVYYTDLLGPGAEERARSNLEGALARL